MFVKVCGLRTEADVESAVSAGADAVGFVLTESVRQVGVDVARRLAAHRDDRRRSYRKSSGRWDTWVLLRNAPRLVAVPKCGSEPVSGITGTVRVEAVRGCCLGVLAEAGGPSAPSYQSGSGRAPCPPPSVPYLVSSITRDCQTPSIS
jgi:hypothetical protein